MPNEILNPVERMNSYEVGQPLTRKELHEMTDYYLNSYIKGSKNLSDNDRKLIRAHYDGDYSHIDEFAYKGKMLKKRTLLSMKYFDQIMVDNFGDTWDQAKDFADGANRIMELPGGPEKLRKIVDEYGNHLFFRLGLSCAARMQQKAESPSETAGYHLLYSEEVRVTTKMVEDTIAPLSPERKEAIRKGSLKEPEKIEQLLEQNDEQQLAMAKHFLMMQIGGIRQRFQERGEQVGSTATMAELIAHGGRLVVTLPTGDAHKQEMIMDSVMGDDRGKAAGVSKRSAATHDVKSKMVNAEGKVLREAQETNPKTGSWSNNYGMNFAGGGMGNNCMGTRELNYNDGRSGHCYIKVVPGDHTHCGQMLIGFETSEPGKKTLYGLPHNWQAKSAPQSSFLADKSTPGIKIDGREVDLSNLAPETLASVMNRFEQRYRELQKLGDLEKIKDINHMITGKMMTTKNLSDFLHNELGFSATSAVRIATEARYSLMVQKDNLSDDAKYLPPAEELAIHSCLNRVCGEERTEPANIADRSTRAVASQAKRDEMARLVKGLGAGKFGINSGPYRKLLTAAQNLQNDMELLATGNLSKIDRAQLIARIEQETKDLQKLAGNYVEIRGKGKPHPEFSSSWGGSRFYAARGLMYLTEKIREDLSLAREMSRPQILEERKAETEKKNGGISQEITQIKEMKLGEVEEKVGVHVEEKQEDFSKKRQEMNPIQHVEEKEHVKQP